MLWRSCCAISCLLFSCQVLRGQSITTNEPEAEAVWRLEQTYWQYCKALDLEKYSTLWHPDVLGWPSMFSAPSGKIHISEWLTDRVAQGWSIKAYELEPLAIKVTGAVAVVHYRVKYSWVDKSGKEMPVSSRITHTWIKVSNDWQIIGGMSSPVDAQGR